jgi:hypothetical protein
MAALFFLNSLDFRFFQSTAMTFYWINRAPEEAKLFQKRHAKIHHSIPLQKVEKR